MNMVKISGITAGYRKKTVIENISFEINEGELVGILGGNGCGKSTFVKAICNILPHDGEVLIEGEKVDALKPREISNRISYIPQKSGVSIDLSVLDVVLMGFNPKLHLFEHYGKTMVQKAAEMIDCVGLAEKKEVNYMLLSEGQKQLAVLARALVSDGKLLVMDEPESALDFRVRYKMLHLIKQWIKDGKRAGLVTLHDTNLALNHCDRLILMKDKIITGMINPQKDSIAEMEEKLDGIYGDVGLTKTKDKAGKEQIVMIYNSEAL